MLVRLARQFAILPFLLLTLLFCNTAQVASQVNVDSKVQVNFTGFVLNRSTNTFDTLATITNKSSDTLSSPMWLAITGFTPSGVSLANPAGQTSSGAPYVIAPLPPSGLLAGGSVGQILLKFQNPARTTFSFSSSVLAAIVTPNTPPVANAGPDQTVFVGDTVTLNGSGSSDADGDPLTFKWAFISVPSGSTAALSNSTAVNPTFVVDRAGSYTVRLTVNDGTVDSVADIVIVSTQNSRPIANAGPDQTTFVGNTVTLNGSKSSDFDGDPLTYKWSFVSRPSGSSAALQNSATVNPTFVVDRFGDYVTQLIVNDGFVDSVAATVKISTLNSPPIAKAGANQTAFVGDVIVLDGSGSSDADGNALSYSWSFVSRPIGSTATLQNPTSVNPSFTIDKFGDYVIQLIVNDGTIDSKPATVTISTLNSPPVANAGPDQSVFIGDLVQLNGSGSTDVDGNQLGFAWSITSKPANSQAALSDPLIINPTFTVDVAGAYIVQLLVTDGTVTSAVDTVSISTEDRPPLANAGPDQTVPLDSTVQLDGSASSDPDKDTLTYTWSLLSTPNGSSAALSDPYATNPTFTADVAGNYVAQLIVNDGHAGSAPDTVAISTENSIPIADAGQDQTVNAGSAVQLDGSYSYDPDGSQLYYFWSITTLPAGSSAVLSDPSIVNPTFMADRSGTYVAQLIVGDGSLVSPPVTVMITANMVLPNQSPVANNDAAITATNTPVDIDVLANDNDPDGDPLSITDVTQGSNGTVSNFTTTTRYTPNPGFHGLDSFTYQISDGRGGTAQATVTVTVDQAPLVDAGSDQKIILPATANLDGTVVDDGLPNPPGLVTTQWTQTSGPATVIFGDAFAIDTTASFPQAGTYVLRLTADDGYLTVFDEVQISVSTAVVEALPPDPTISAPPGDASVATTAINSTEFLYTGTNPIQTGVAPGTITPTRAAVIRGKVLDRSGAALSGVTISILSHPEFGATLSRSNGVFDMAVNGGGLLTINFQKTGFLPVQRQVNVPWQDFVVAPDVTLITVDSLVTTIAANAAAMQVARGSVMSDSDGTRQATLLFPAGTTANMIIPNGSTQPLTTLNVRATEYTVGSTGPSAMPGELPATSGYTYAVELSADEAIAAGAKSVTFNQPVFHYIENFLAFPIGTIIPVGFYDRDLAVWLPSENGRSVKITDVSGGVASVDTVGTGGLTPITLSTEERQQLALLYSVGQELWRVPVPHFSPWDANAPMFPPSDAEAAADDPDSDKPLDVNCDQKGSSVVGCQDQTLGEAIPVVGTRFKLHYQSERVPGRKTAYTLEIQLSGGQVPNSLRQIELEVQVAGRLFRQTFAPTPNQRTAFTWDGKDAYGRTLQGSQPMTVRIGYTYRAVYAATTGFGVAGTVVIAGSRARQEVTLWRTWQQKIGAWNAPGVGLGGWTLSPHHTYDLADQVLYRGDGRRQSTKALGPFISRFAGNNFSCGSGNGGLATQAGVCPWGVAVGADGSVYIVEAINHVVRRVAPNGIITAVAGIASVKCASPTAPCGDGGLATQAQLTVPLSVAVGRDNSLYIADTGNLRIRKVNSNGIITTVAGNGTTGFSGDGGPAQLAQLSNPVSIALGPDDSLYIADQDNNRIRRVGPDGIISTVAGNGQPCTPTTALCGDGGPATVAAIRPEHVAVGRDGIVYIAAQSRVRRVGADGIISTVAGNGLGCGSLTGTCGDGGPASQANLNALTGFAIGPDDTTIYLAQDSFRVRWFRVNGNINTLAGPFRGSSGDGGLAPQATLDGVRQIGVGPDGSVYVPESAGSNQQRVRRIAPIAAGSWTDGFIVPAVDGSEVYIFNQTGRHLRTLDGLNGALRYEFTYDSAGRLATVTDRSGNVTTIQHDGSGKPTAIIGPFGQSTALAVNLNSYLSQIINPAGEAVQLAYTVDGLLTGLTNPRGHSSSYAYDGLGRLTRATDPTGAAKTFSRAGTNKDFTVTMTSALGRTTVYRVEQLSTGNIQLTTTDSAGALIRSVIGKDGSQTVTDPDGTVVSAVFGPDPRWKMQAPLTTSLKVTTPGGKIRTTSIQRTATLANAVDLLSLLTFSETVTTNARTLTNSYDAKSRTFSSTSPTGRRINVVVDDRGRPVQQQIVGLDAIIREYDVRGRLKKLTQGTGPTLRTATFTYNSAGFLETLTDPLGRIARFNYDAAGRIVQQVKPDNQTIGLAYDANSNLMTVAPSGRPDHTFTYDPVNLLSTYTPPDVGPGDEETLTSYNADRQLTRVALPTGQDVELSYDGASGRLSNVTLLRGQMSYGYDATSGNLAAIGAPDGTLAYSYDGELPTGTTWSGAVAGSVGRTFDNNFRVATESVNGANTVAFLYDSDGLLTGTGSLTLSRNAQTGLVTGTTIGSATDAFGYNSFGEVTSHSAAFSSSNVFNDQYIRDALGRITQKSETIGGVTDTFNYSYDLTGRLSEVRKNGIVTAAYTYDANGNRLTGPSGTTAYTYDDQDRLLTSTSAFAYTANGELLSKTQMSASTTYQYDELGNLVRSTLPTGTQIDYLIDGQNRRIGKKVNGTPVQKFLYADRLKAVAELDGNNNIVSRFVYSTGINVPAYMIKGGVTYRIVTDHLGSPRLAINFSTGAIAQRLDYDEFGNVTLDTNPGFQPFGFAGGLYDSDTKLVRFGARDYDAETGRWTAKDPIRFRGGDANLYGYVLGDPINRVDRRGLWFGELVNPIWRPIPLDPDSLKRLLDPCPRDPDIAEKAKQDVGDEYRDTVADEIADHAFPPAKILGPTDTLVDGAVGGANLATGMSGSFDADQRHFEANGIGELAAHNPFRP